MVPTAALGNITLGSLDLLYLHEFRSSRSVCGLLSFHNASCTCYAQFVVHAHNGYVSRICANVMCMHRTAAERKHPDLQQDVDDVSASIVSGIHEWCPFALIGTVSDMARGISAIVPGTCVTSAAFTCNYQSPPHVDDRDECGSGLMSAIAWFAKGIMATSNIACQVSECGANYILCCCVLKDTPNLTWELIGYAQGEHECEGLGAMHVNPLACAGGGVLGTLSRFVLDGLGVEFLIPSGSFVLFDSAEMEHSTKGCELDATGASARMAVALYCKNDVSGYHTTVVCMCVAFPYKSLMSWNHVQKAMYHAHAMRYHAHPIIALSSARLPQKVFGTQVLNMAVEDAQLVTQSLTSTHIRRLVAVKESKGHRKTDEEARIASTPIHWPGMERPKKIVKKQA